MASNPPAACCTVGVKHQGEAKGQFQQIGDGIKSSPLQLLQEVRLTITVEAYISHPADHSTKRAILLLTDVIGHRFINAQLIADQLAANGYFVVMPDLFHGDPVPLNLPTGFDLMAWLKGPPGHLPDRVEPVVQEVFKEMKSSLGCERIGAIGYCFGVSIHLHSLCLQVVARMLIQWHFLYRPSMLSVYFNLVAVMSPTWRIPASLRLMSWQPSRARCLLLLPVSFYLCYPFYRVANRDIWGIRDRLHLPGLETPRI